METATKLDLDLDDRSPHAEDDRIGSPAADKPRPAVRPAAKKRPTGSVDDLLQQMEAVDAEVLKAQAELEQVNRRIAELERRRQALGDQLALTLRSRIPAEILRLAASEGGKPGAANEQAG